MNREIAESLSRLKASQKATRAYEALIRDLSAEARDRNGGATEFGKMRRHRPDHGRDMEVGLLLRGGNYLAALFAHILNEQNLRAAIQYITQTAQTLQEHLAENRYVKVSDTLQAGHGVQYGQVAVAPEVATQLGQEVTLVASQDKIIERKLEAGFFGPFGAHKRRHDLMQDFRLRREPVSGQYAHCVEKVKGLNEKLACDLETGTCTVRVFGVVAAAPATSRGQKVNVAEVGEGITASDVAQVAAAAPVITAPPQFNFVG